MHGSMGPCKSCIINFAPSICMHGLRHHVVEMSVDLEIAL